MFNDIGSYPLSSKDASLPLKLVPEVVLILADTFVPVGVTDVICGLIASNGTFWEAWTESPPPNLVVLNAGSVDAVETFTR